MDKRKTWRNEEQQLIERWNAAAARQQALQAQLMRHADAGESASEALLQEAVRARADMELVRREVARMKVQFYSGKRY
ncbi:MAG TPA: hypothetical protein VJT77_06020 [Burkholderiales bacterium]|nr:hypothetical protein [Burkholderiales bacterium]